ncbi:MAG: hypothetical protein VX658_06090 [Pseudomonadota bacterium]|jgi:hypothetical protein|nr:hypothetical protein [Pseudomonadota bacterium]|tara:strand:- start:312 stop:1016 length:705 start_codon:yes stop_codon:yes gene_type:complete
MITIGYSVIGAVAFACFIFGIRAYMVEPNRILFLILINTSLLWFDSFATAVGQYIGEGSLLLNMTYVRYAAHWLTLPLLFIVAGMILKAADFKFAQSKYVMGFFVFLAVFFIVYDFRYMFILDFYPVCYAETFRYATQVPIGQECSPGMAGLGTKVLPIAPILLTLILFVSGIAIWIKHKWPWLAVGCFVMLMAAQPTPIGPILSNAGEPVFIFCLMLAAIKFGANSKEEIVSS